MHRGLELTIAIDVRKAAHFLVTYLHKVKVRSEPKITEVALCPLARIRGALGLGNTVEAEPTTALGRPILDLVYEHQFANQSLRCLTVISYALISSSAWLSR